MAAILSGTSSMSGSMMGSTASGCRKQSWSPRHIYQNLIHLSLGMWEPLGPSLPLLSLLTLFPLRWILLISSTCLHLRLLWLYRLLSLPSLWFSRNSFARMREHATRAIRVMPTARSGSSTSFLRWLTGKSLSPFFLSCMHCLLFCFHVSRIIKIHKNLKIYKNLKNTLSLFPLAPGWQP